MPTKRGFLKLFAASCVALSVLPLVDAIGGEMLCRNPFTNLTGVFPCGQCMPCRVNRVRMWTHRIMLEAHLHETNAFVTLTYSDQSLPKTSQGLPTLALRDLQLWFKQLRREIHPSKIRYFAVGEYGDETQRPHYHVALFGYSPCHYGTSRYSRSRRDCCPSCDLILRTWGRGQVYIGDVSTSSAQYIAGYVTKKLTNRSDPRLMGRQPEFARMSLKPGIGADFMHEVGSALLAHAALDAMADAPASLQHGTRNFPLGRYLRGKLREIIGRENSAPPSTVKAVSEELRPLREAAFNGSRSFKDEIIKTHDQAVRNREERAKIFKQKRVL